MQISLTHAEPELKRQLNGAGLRATNQRIMLLRCLKQSDSPRSAESLHTELGDWLDLVTVYRALEQFCESGLARRIEIKNNHALYESADSHHHHVVCTSCGAVADVDACVPDSLIATVQKVSGFASLRDHSLEFFGICAVCAKK